MLNYNKIKSDIQDSGYTLRDFSKAVGHSENWIFKALKQENLSVNDLLTICKVLKKSVFDYFDLEYTNNTSSIVNTDSKKELLKEILEVNKQMLFELKSLNKT